MNKNKKMVITRVERILANAKAACGTYPGQNRSRKFADKRKEADRKACRGRVDR